MMLSRRKDSPRSFTLRPLLARSTIDSKLSSPTSARSRRISASVSRSVRTRAVPHAPRRHHLQRRAGLFPQDGSRGKAVEGDRILIPRDIHLRQDFEQLRSPELSVRGPRKGAALRELGLDAAEVTLFARGVRQGAECRNNTAALIEVAEDL